MRNVPDLVPHRRGIHDKMAKRPIASSQKDRLIGYAQPRVAHAHERILLRAQVPPRGVVQAPVVHQARAAHELVERHSRDLFRSGICEDDHTIAISDKYTGKRRRIKNSPQKFRVFPQYAFRAFPLCLFRPEFRDALPRSFPAARLVRISWIMLNHGVPFGFAADAPYRPYCSAHVPHESL